ncbi:uncharacterized protein Fot_48582 [Forsythia ovata]|uniref:Uncharacterized protein n=1 Tax=Forsythia ovata TaxID=205694 RepID=A0ABD1Q9M0_9LAMI
MEDSREVSHVMKDVPNVDPFEPEKGSNALNSVPTQNPSGTGVNKNVWKQMGNEEKKTAAVNEEMSRLNRLPANSSYASHRLRVLNKILQLLSIQRTTSQDEELELLFAGLHI